MDGGSTVEVAASDDCVGIAYSSVRTWMVTPKLEEIGFKVRDDAS